jgi:Protein of unknown function (DUF4031)
MTSPGFTEDITRRARWARDHNSGHPKWAWSTGEQVAVALILRDDEWFTAAGWTIADAAQRVAGDIGADSMSTVKDWVDEVRAALGPTPGEDAGEPAGTPDLATVYADIRQLMTDYGDPERDVIAVFVDNFRVPARVGRLTARWSHLTVEPDGDLDELHAFAARIGLKRSWFQGPPEHRHPHYDVTDSKRQAAIAAGAVPITWREAGRMLADASRRRREAAAAASEEAGHG